MSTGGNGIDRGDGRRGRVSISPPPPPPGAAARRSWSTAVMLTTTAGRAARRGGRTWWPRRCGNRRRRPRGWPGSRARRPARGRRSRLPGVAAERHTAGGKRRKARAGEKEEDHRPFRSASRRGGFVAASLVSRAHLVPRAFNSAMPSRATRMLVSGAPAATRERGRAAPPGSARRRRRSPSPVREPGAPPLLRRPAGAGAATGPARLGTRRALGRTRGGVVRRVVLVLVRVGDPNGASSAPPPAPHDARGAAGRGETRAPAAPSAGRRRGRAGARPSSRRFARARPPSESRAHRRPRRRRARAEGKARRAEA